MQHTRQASLSDTVLQQTAIIGYAFQGEPLISAHLSTEITAKSLMLSASFVKFVKYFSAKTVAVNTSLKYAHKRRARLPWVISFIFYSSVSIRMIMVLFLPV